MTESDLEALENKIHDLAPENATKISPEDLGVTDTELDNYIENSKGQFIAKSSDGNYFKKFNLFAGFNKSIYILDPQSTVYTKDDDLTVIPDVPMVYAVQPKDIPVEYSEGSYNKDNSKWKPITENIQKIIDLNSQ